MPRAQAAQLLPRQGLSKVGYLAMFMLIMGLTVSGVWLTFCIWSQAKSDQAHDLYQVGDFAGAFDAEVYYRDCRGCDSTFRATITFPDGSRTVELTDVDWNRDDVPTGKWVTAPPPYDGIFVVYYYPDHPRATSRIMTVEDVERWVYSNDITGYWIAFGVLVVLTSCWVRPTVRAHVEAEQKIRAVRSAMGHHSDEIAVHGTQASQVDEAIVEALDRIETRTRERTRTNRFADLVLAGGLVLTGVGVLLCATDARTAAIATHLQTSGSLTTASDALITLDTRSGSMVSHEVFAEIEVPDQKGNREQVPVELLVPTRAVDESLDPGWYTNIAPYDFEFDVRYDADHSNWVVAEADLSHLAHPGDIVFPILVLLGGVAICVGVIVGPMRHKARRAPT